MPTCAATYVTIFLATKTPLSPERWKAIRGCLLRLRPVVGVASPFEVIGIAKDPPWIYFKFIQVKPLMSNSELQEALAAPDPIVQSRFQERHLALTGAGSEIAGASKWHCFNSPNRLLTAAAMLESGNVLLPFGGDGFRPLAMLVGDLRALGNDGLRIIIREEGKSLRLAQATALVKLGVSLILPRALEPGTMKQRILSLEGTRHRGPFRRDVEAVIRQVRLVPTHQRMLSENFRTLAHSVVDYESDALPSTLVVLHPLTAVEGRKIDKSLSLGLRDGVYTVSPEGIWILLMACKPFDCQLVLERVIGAQFESLLVGWRKIGKSIDILSAIDAMHESLDDIEMLMA